MRYEIQGEELAVLFSREEINRALAWEAAKRSAHGLSSGELIYGSLVDAVNEKTGVPSVDWRQPGSRIHPVSVESGFEIRTQ